jgi:hypothetical protein
VAGYRYLNQLEAEIRDNALETLSALLRSEADDGGGREAEALEAAVRDVVASQNPEFKLNALVAALARIIAGQQEEIAEIKRTKATASALSAVKKGIKK